MTSAAITDATPNNLLGPGANNTFTGPTAINNDNTTAVPITTSTQLVGTAGATSNDLATAITNGSVLKINNNTITFSTGQTTTTVDGNGNITIGTGNGSTATVQTVLTAIDSITAPPRLRRSSAASW